MLTCLRSLNQNFTDSILTGELIVEGFSKPFRYDRNKSGGGLLIYAREGVPAKQLTSYKLPNDIELAAFELNRQKQKWLLLSASLL